MPRLGDRCSDAEEDSGEASQRAEWDPSHQEAVRKSLAKMLIVDRLPYTFLEQLGFKRLMSFACPDLKMPSEETVTADSHQLFINEKEKMKQHLKDNCAGRVSLTVDRWKSLHETEYICVTAHYIDNEWKVNKRILSFSPITAPEGVEIGKAIESCLMDWGINEVFSITVDSGSWNDVAINYMRDRFNQSGTGILGGKFLHVRCVAEIINLVAFDSLTEMSKSVNRVREAMKCIRQNEIRLLKFKDRVATSEENLNNVPLCNDEPTNWKSTYLMLKSASLLEEELIHYALVDEEYRLDLLLAEDNNGERIGIADETDWANVKWLVKFLKLLYDLTFSIHGSSNITSNGILNDICFVPKKLNEWITSTDPELSKMAMQMKDKYEKQWRKVEKNNELLCIAAMLDPRYKLRFVEFVLSKMYQGDAKFELRKQVKQAADQLFHHYKTMFDNLWWLHESLENETDNYSDEFEQEMCRKHDSSGETELVWYLRDNGTKWDEQVSILKWWKLMSGMYPVLSKMARDVLAVPITTVASEAAFNACGRVLDEFTSSLSSSLAEVHICTRDWVRSKPELVPVGEKLNELEAKMESDRIDELEEMENPW
ncbi:Zinc finger BED domain-containing protein RICESLEEPER 2 [Linum perenne]